MSEVFIFSAKEGKMIWGSVYNHQRFVQCLKENEGKDFRIEPLKSTRSLSQNALYHLFIDVICKETGNDHNNLHEYFKREFLTPKFIRVIIKGKEIERKIPASTTELSKTEFIDYMDKISAQTEIAIPDTEAFLGWRDSSPLVGETYINALNML